MNKTTLPDPSELEISFCDAIDQIIHPIKEEFNINYFCFQKLYWKGKFLSICNHRKFADYFCENHLSQYTNDLPLPMYSEVINLEEVDPNSETYQHIIKAMAEKFDITQLIALVAYYRGATAIYTFGVPSEVKNFRYEFMTNLDYFKQFTFYFTEKAANIINQVKAKAPKIKIHSDLGPKIKEALSVFLKKLKRYSNKALYPTRYYLNGIFDDIYFTRAETKSLRLLSYGYNYQEIAAELNISVRTVHDHINQVKQKLKCHNRTEMLRMFHVIGGVFPMIEQNFSTRPYLDRPSLFTEFAKTICIEHPELKPIFDEFLQHCQEKYHNVVSLTGDVYRPFQKDVAEN